MVLGYWYVYKISAAASAESDKAVPVVQKQARPSVKEIVALVFKNPPLLMLIIAETFRNTCLFMITSFAFYYFGYVLKNSAFLSVFILAISLAALFGTFAAAWIGVKMGKRNCYWIFQVLATFVFISALLVGKATWGFTIIFCIAYMLVMIAGSMSTALFADTAVYGEWKTGKDIQAFIMSLLVLPIKVGVLFRSAVITMGLTAIGFVANTVPTEKVASGISSIMIFAPAIASIIAAVIFYFGYRIEDKDVLKMQDEIASR
jgi:GPH family glycoside/pentoside/hexuronide:cation symporter